MPGDFGTVGIIWIIMWNSKGMCNLMGNGMGDCKTVILIDGARLALLANGAQFS